MQAIQILNLVIEALPYLVAILLIRTIRDALRSKSD